MILNIVSVVVPMAMITVLVQATPYCIDYQYRRQCNYPGVLFFHININPLSVTSKLLQSPLQLQLTGEQ